jgi:hypothetical protein
VTETPITPYHVVELSHGRRAWINAFELGGPTHWMTGLLEADVTVPRQVIAAHKARTGEALSFTGYLIYCFARAVDDNKDVQSYLKGRRHIVVFDDVDVGVMVENTSGAQRGLMLSVIRGAQRKTYRQIHDEIRAAQAAPPPPGRGFPGWLRSALLLPWPLSSIVKAVIKGSGRRNPATLISASGTVFLSAVGMFGKGHSGWGIAASPQSCSLIVGGIASKPAVIEGRIEPREIINLTVMLNHDVIDGAPAARFVRRLIELIESGEGLEEAEAVQTGEGPSDGGNHHAG